MDRNITPQPDLEDYKRFFDETPVALIRTDLKTGEFIMANRYAVAMFGFDSFDELKAKCSATDLYAGDMAREELLAKIKKHGMVQDYEIKFGLPNGKTIYVSARLRINCGGTCVEGSMIDITRFVELRDKHLAKLKEVSNKLDTKIAALAG
jgi:PAS domain S-box-containing protein